MRRVSTDMKAMNGSEWQRWYKEALSPAKQNLRALNKEKLLW
jgi:hypothetical protein